MAGKKQSDEVFGGAGIKSLWVGDPDPDAGYFRLAEDFAVPASFPVTVAPDDAALPVCHILVAFEGRKPTCADLRLEQREQPIDGTMLRKVPLSTYLREAVAHAAFRFTRDRAAAEKAREELGGQVGREREVDGEPAWVFREPDKSMSADVLEVRGVAKKSSRQPRRGIPLTDDDLRDIAAMYREAVRVSRAPTEALAQRMGVSRPTMSRWIAKARERGFLGPARQGSAG